MRKILLITLILLLDSNAFATDPPNLLAYKQMYLYAIDNGVSGAFDQIDAEYEARFVTFTKPVDSTLNKPGGSSVYYDGAKSMREFYELCNDRTGLTAGEIAILNQIPSYIEKVKEIIAHKYIAEAAVDDDAGGGYMAYPHGLSYVYSETGDTDAYDGLVAVRQIGTWVENYSQYREHHEYARDGAYSLQTGIMASKYGIGGKVGKLSTPDLMAQYLSHGLSHLNQWATGTFYDYNSMPFYIAPFISGLTAAGLIEYFERIDDDAAIPPKIKAWLDWLYPLMWYPDITDPNPPGDTSSYSTANAGGAWWVYADWVTDQYVIPANHYPSSWDVAPLHAMLIGQAYAWYAVYSGDSSYMTKANEMFTGLLANPPINNINAQLWESTRYVHEYVKWYRRFNGTPCGTNTLDQCLDSTACAGAGGNWSGEYCRHQAVTVTTLSGLAWTGEGGQQGAASLNGSGNAVLTGSGGLTIQ